MTIGLRQHGAALLVALAVMLIAPVLPAGAQGLPPDIYTASPLTAEQQDLITAFGQTHAKTLRGDSGVTDQQVAQARTSLMQALVLPSTAEFRAAISEAVSSQLAGALDNPSEFVRINVMIIAARLNYTPVVVDLITRGLKDASPAVRYWSVKAIRTPAIPPGGVAPPPPPPDAQARLLQELGTLLENEDAGEVLEQVLLAMVDLAATGNNQALGAVIDSLNRRVNVHINQPGLAYTAETIGLNAAYGQLLRVQQQQAGAVNDFFTQIARAAARYMALIARQGRQNEIPPAHLEAAKRMLDLDYTILSAVHKSSGANIQIPALQQFSLDLRQNNWEAVEVAANRFRDMLTAAPFNLDAADVIIAAD